MWRPRQPRWRARVVMWDVAMCSLPMKVLVWNVRGPNAPARRSAVHQLVLAANPGIVCLQETKMQEITVPVVQQCLVNKFGNFYYVPAVGTRGGILLACDVAVTRVSNPHYQNNSLTALVKSPSAAEWWMTCVYGPQDYGAKVEFLQELADIRELHAGPWLIAGDFNLIAK